MESSKRYWESTCENLLKETRIILNEYLLSLKLELKAEATISKYRKYLERFLRECSTPLDQLTSEEVLTWLNQFSQDKKPKTIDLVFSALSSFFQYCLQEEYMENVLMKKRWKPKIPQSLPKYLNEQEVARLKRAAENLSIRNRALILFLLSTGCRESEVVNLTIQEVDVDKRTAIVEGKGKKIRHVHFSEECGLVLKDYLRTRSGNKIEPLFLNKFGQALGKNGIYLVTRKLGKQAGFTQTLHPHVLRHTFATNMLARGADLQFIADEMGHEDLNTTRIYARIPTEDMILKYQNIMG
ncbi:tyrosine-type recombinase/integrase [Sporosarcina sp. ACRSM]|uniref:site-specific tyrosine recombinase/integron integrase n=1 Tax=Sporosarcina sp. ACRSM TaxID=2918216 RepID=UPI001EF4D361|nr:site-specific tyrosine recombinase/integron integrase [Sporosarcina sp. ACRSM]MCG7337173.1 tyrosine-type recombinase/integrase [Sporosarcina sp. ACRSM]